MPDASPLTLDGRPLAPARVAAFARGSGGLRLDPNARAAMNRAREVVEAHAASSSAHYGINTGFGSLARTRIAPDGLRAVQHNLVRSHAAGVGDPLDRTTVRAMGCLLAASLARGRSGVRPEVVEHVGRVLEADLVPVVPSRGSVGASGDLAPLAHFALALLGEGAMRRGADGADGPARPADECLAAAGIAPLALEAKEGLALLNGTHLMAAQAVLGLEDAATVLDAAISAAAMAIDACRASLGPYDERLVGARAHPGPVAVAAHVRDLLDGSAIVTAHLENDPRVQDPYCLRAAPQVLGAALDHLEHLRTATERELAAVTDNPLVFPAEGGGDVVSGGNFHGMPIAIALDAAPLAVAHAAGIAERRVFWILAAHDQENPVTPYLSPDPGLHSGLMIAQYTAAANVNELQTLCAPSTPGNVSTSAGIEDYNSFGPAAGRRLAVAVERAAEVVAIELLVMAEALEHQRPLRSGAGVERLHGLVRDRVAKLERDRPPAPDIAALVDLVRSGVCGPAALLATA